MYGTTDNLHNHSNYTTIEWSTSPYYTKVIKILLENQIKSFIDIGSCSGAVYEILKKQIPSLCSGILIEANPSNTGNGFRTIGPTGINTIHNLFERLA